MYLKNDQATRNAFKVGWESFINNTLGPFDWFMHLTFANPDISLVEARNRFNRYAIRINEDLFGRRYREDKKGVSYACVTEKQKARRAIHFHCVMGGGVDKLDPKIYERLWRNFKAKPCRAGKRVPTLYENGMALIEPFMPELNGIRYMLKQIEYGDEIEFYSPITGKKSAKITDR